jgi:enoyl-CoA hydratase/carnithine racemase
VAYQVLQYETRGDVALITLNRPEKLNAWTPQMSLEQVDSIERANADRQVGAVVMTGAGRGFCAGADMEQTFKERIEGRDPGGDTAHGEGGMPAGIDWVALCRRSKPLVAAVNGAAVGIGMTMILPFDVIVASEKARFGMLFIKVGLVPELASIC